MAHPYIPRGDGEERAMLDAIGAASFEELVAAVPEKFRLSRDLELAPGRSEIEVTRHFETLAARNGAGPGWLAFLGGGSYDHGVPAAVDHLSFRSEFYTAYTPYQPEVGQGTLTTIFEFQTMMAGLTGMELANASLYDGATALAEAALVGVAHTGRKHVIVAGPMHRNYAQVLETYCQGMGIRVSLDPAPDGVVDRTWLQARLAEEPAVVAAAFPNFLGIVEDLTGVFTDARAAGAVSVAVFQPHALVLYKTPAEMGADIAVGEGQSLGTPPSGGGPSLGLFAARGEFARLVPGRLIGETVDRDGKRAFVMTLQTREQHIRRFKANSNICTNQGLMALRATIYMSLLGPQGMREVAEHCLERAHYVAAAIDGRHGYRLAYGAPFFREFVVECPIPADRVVASARLKKILPGIALGRFKPEWENRLLVCCSEKHNREDLDALIGALAGAAEVAHV